MKKINVFTIVKSLPLKQIQSKSLGKSNRDKEIRQGTTMRKTPNTRPLKQSPNKQILQRIYRSLNVLKSSGIAFLPN